MKIKLISILALLLWGVGTHAQTFDKLWKQVEQAEKKSLPKTVIQVTDQIFQKASAEKNSPQMLKAYTWRMRYRDMLTPDSFYVNLEGLERWAETTDKPMDQAVLHSLLAGMYADYAMGNRWQIRQRRDIVEELPTADIRQWAGNQFVQQVIKHTRASLKEPNQLLATSSRIYIPFVELGETSEYYRHDLYHLLGSRGTEALQNVMGIDNDSIVVGDIKMLYQQMMAAYEKSGSEGAAVLVTLNYLNWNRLTDSNFRPYQARKGLIGLTQDPYLAGLNKLIADYKSSPVCAEVYLAKARYAIDEQQQISALQLCDEAIRLYPGYKRINALKALKEEILNPVLNVRTDATVYPSAPMKLQVSHRNLDGFTVRFYRVNLSEENVQKRNIDDAFYRKYCQLVSETALSLLRPTDYQMKDTTFTLPAPGVGFYLMQVIPNDKAGSKSYSLFYSTRFKVLTRGLPAARKEVVVLDQMSGQPIADAVVTFYSRTDEVLKEATTNVEGEIVLDAMEKCRNFRVRKGEDTALPSQIVRWNTYQYENNQGSEEQVSLLTDRALYRPGQTVYVKGIVYAQQGDTAQVVTGRDVTLSLLDANREEIAKQELRTNDFGSFTANFILPQACLNGVFTLQTQQGTTHIRVEEYKRPTFDITFNRPTDSYSLGDKIELTGTVATFSGVTLQNLPIQYTVTRYQRFGWRGMPGMNANNNPIASGSVTLTDEGKFSIPVSLIGEANDQQDRVMEYYSFQVDVTVTSVSGETQSSSFNLAVGNRSLLLGSDLNGRICTDSTIQTRFSATNLNGELVAVEGTVQLFLVTDVKLEKVAEKAAYTGTFTSNKETRLDSWSALPSGTYVLLLSAKDNQGRAVEFKTTLVLFSTKDTRPATHSPLWYYAVNTKFDAQHPATFYFGTSFEETYVLMDVFCGDRLLESKRIQLTDSIQRFDYPYQESYGNGLFITFCFVKENVLYQEEVSLSKRLADKELSLRWDVFRDKLRPGQEEEWKLTIRTPQGAPAVAEMLATMYDASLDEIWKQKQELMLYYHLPLPRTYWTGGYTNIAIASCYSHFSLKDLKVPGLMYDRFMLASIWTNRLEGKQTNARMMQYGVVANGVSSRMKHSFAEPLMEVAVVGDVAKSDVGTTEESMDEILPESTVDLRTNFAETAFFYPQLRTNEQGEVSFAFTLPQSLTRWNFRGYAHTKGMLTGMIESQATTSKEFMLTPNLPRFVRVGDKTSVAASIANLTGKNLSGVATFILFNPLTEKVISTQKQKYSVEAGKTIGISFLFPVSDKYDLLGCRMIADSGTFSDGEQQLLPVLSDKVNLVESVPMAIRGKKTRTFSLDSLFNGHSKSATTRRLTVEFTGNPSWYAVQALPALGLPTTDNAISWAAMYYANTLASYIMNSQPRIKTIFDSWKLDGGTKETFLSNLQKNQEVKNILLASSPWLMEATTEQQQQERIATLFDLNNIRNNNLTALNKLKELQCPDGSWPWYKGMNGSSSITSFVVETNARLAMLTGEPLTESAQALQRSAFGYLHQAALNEYKALRKADKENKTVGLSRSALNYLYLLAISKEKVPAHNQSAYNYFLSKVSEMLTTQSMTTKALSAIVLQKAGREKEAEAFLASLREFLVQTPEQGMHFAFNENPYTWGGLAVPAHVDVMEAFEEVGNDSLVVEEMKLWLLKQKQTQQWDSPVSTVDAVYALLSGGTSLLDNQGDVRISLGGKVLESSSSAISGLGYIKQTFTEKRVVDANQVTVEKRDAGIAWGAVYGQYQESIDQVKQQGGALNVEKKLYVERLVNNVRQLQPITDKTILAVGETVVSRLTLRLDRPMEFIQLNDQRGACFEPISTLSGYRWNNGLGYYIDVKDAATNFFFDGLGKGVFVLEYSYCVSRAGSYEAGLAFVQSAYAPEFVSHSSSMKVEVK